MKMTQERTNLESNTTKMQSQLSVYDSKVILLSTEIERLSKNITEKNNEIQFYITREKEILESHSKKYTEIKKQFEDTMKIRIVNF